MKVLVCPITYNAEIRVELLPFLADATRDGAEVLPLVRLPLDVARNLAVEEVRNRKAEVLIQLDADMAPAPDSYAALVAQAQSEVCVAACPYCGPGGHVNYICHGSTGTGPLEAKEARGVIQVEYTAVGVTAFNLEVFDAMPQPYFEHEYTPSHSRQTLTEDFTFCKKCKAPLYVLADFWADHMLVKRIGRPSPLTLDDLRELELLLGH